MQASPANKLRATERLLEPNWYNLLPSQHRVPTHFLPVCRRFYDYLLQDGTFIHPRYVREDDGEYVQVKEDEEVEGADDIDLNSLPLFEDIEEVADKCLKQFNGQVFIKIGWKSPKDCTSWLPGLKCTHIQDLFMAFKCSEYISEVLTDYQPFWWAEGETVSKRLSISIKEFTPVDKSLEFRCFIRENSITAICQRNPECLYQHLIEDQQKYRQKITEFITTNLMPIFPVSRPEERYVADIAILGGNVVVISIDPWRQFTNPLMFTWQELESNTKQVSMKIVKTKEDIICEDLRQYNIPAEFAEGDKTQIVQLMQLMKKNPQLFY